MFDTLIKNNLYGEQKNWGPGKDFKGDFNRCRHSGRLKNHIANMKCTSHDLYVAHPTI